MPPPLFVYSLTAAPSEADPTAPGLDATVPKDLALDSSGDLEVPPRLVAGAEAVAQRLGIRLRRWAGEWFLDQREGIPYVQSILRKGVDLPLVEALFRRCILETPGVASLASFSSELDRSVRRLSVSFEARLIDGSAVVGTFGPFIATQP